MARRATVEDYAEGFLTRAADAAYPNTPSRAFPSALCNLIEAVCCRLGASEFYEPKWRRDRGMALWRRLVVGIDELADQVDPGVLEGGAALVAREIVEERRPWPTTANALIAALSSAVKPVASGATPSARRQKVRIPAEGSPPPSADAAARMLDRWTRGGECETWTARRWAEYLDVTERQVRRLPAWKMVRDQQRDARAGYRRRRESQDK